MLADFAARHSALRLPRQTGYSIPYTEARTGQELYTWLFCKTVKGNRNDSSDQQDVELLAALVWTIHVRGLRTP